jgi:hypothetical protein
MVSVDHLPPLEATAERMLQPRLRRGMICKGQTQPRLQRGMILYISQPLQVLCNDNTRISKSWYLHRDRLEHKMEQG